MADITIHQTRERLQQAQLVDVREDNEVAQGRVPGALHIPLGQLAGRLAELDRQKPVIAICRSGNRSARATELLSAAGFTCDNMVGGMLAWQAAGLPTA
ncbi:MAG: rhodanese-like domain-containing protein [Propionicimonas sp.]